MILETGVMSGVDPTRYTIILSDGTQIDNLLMNGNNFVSDIEVCTEMFDGKLSHIEIKYNGITEEYDNVSLLQIMEMGGQWYFVLAPIPKEQLEKERLRSDVDYIAMMASIDI